ncbi:MAG: tRNA pseudouridine(13) synthase TruD [Gammaproteobacteria bacterium]|nr:tRNA pseudouridine(13) synthase TruD [Gammaproteobacteria bacterium]
MVPEPVYPYGPPVTAGILKSRPSEFRVSEELGFEPSGEGEHLFLLVEKEGLGTHELISRVARDYSLDPGLIGYSGLKDKHALTRQWLSLHRPGKKPPAELFQGDGYRVLRQASHNRKLRPGTHRYNSFEVYLREVSEFPDQTRQQISAVTRQGFANYFGRQRFGRQQDNVAQALEQLPGRRLKRSRKSILLSSLRSHLFNLILARRISLGHWDLPLEGDVFMLRGSRSIFSETLDARLIERFQALDISSTASLYGCGQVLLTGQPQAIEAQVFADCDAITRCLDQHGARLQMRALRAVVDNFSYDYDAENQSLLLKLDLPAGCYVTNVLDHFITLQDAS